MHFRNGFKYDDQAHRINPLGVRDFMSSNGVTIYTATFWADSTTSCNCPGWVHHGKCKHSREVHGFRGQQRIRVETETEHRARLEGESPFAPSVPGLAVTQVVQRPEPMPRRRIMD